MAAAEVGFEQFVREHASRLLQAAVLLTGNRDRGEELLQDTLTHLYPRWGMVTAADSPIAYVRRTLMNRYVSSSRSPRHRDTLTWDVPERWDRHDLSEEVALRRDIWQALGRLPGRPRAAVILRFFDDQTDEEIAAVLGCRAASVRSIISRAMASMRNDDSMHDTHNKAGSW